MKTTTNLERFVSVFREELKEALVYHPGQYAFGLDKVDEVANRIESALRENRPFSKEGIAVRQTCKKLKVEHTYVGIKKFISSKPNETFTLKLLNHFKQVIVGNN